MEPRSLTTRERAVLDALLAIEFDGAAALREQAAKVLVIACDCGCPSIDFQPAAGLGMTARVNAALRGSFDGLFLYTLDDPHHGELLGGIEWSGMTEPSPDEFPEPHLLDIRPY